MTALVKPILEVQAVAVETDVGVKELLVKETVVVRALQQVTLAQAVAVAVKVALV
jgi:hypothetical protein